MKHLNNSENLTFQNVLTASKCNCGESESTENCIDCDMNEMIKKMLIDAEKENEILESLEDELEDFEDFDEFDYFDDFDEIEVDDYHNVNSFSENIPTEALVFMPYPNYTTTFWGGNVVITYTLKISN